MGKKLQQFTNAPHKLVKKMADRIHSQKSLTFLQKIDVSWGNLAYFVAWINKYAFLENHMIRKLEIELEYIKSITNKQFKEIAVKKILRNLLADIQIVRILNLQSLLKL